MNISYTGEGKVVLIAGGGRVYTDVAARFVRSEKGLDEILAAPYSRKLVRTILKSGHKAAVEFDYFLFGVEGYSRVTEVQLVRKRLASYMIKTGRAQKDGKRSFDVVLPREIESHAIRANVSGYVDGERRDVDIEVTPHLLLKLTEDWYNSGTQQGLPEEMLRYLKPQATEFKGLIGMNAHALLDWFAIRCCLNAQAEIRDMAQKMLALCKEAAPDLFENAGPNCRLLGYCPENDAQNEACKGGYMTKDQAIQVLQAHRQSTLD